MNFTDLIAFVELGTGLSNWGRMGPLHLGFKGINGRREYKNELAYERIINCWHVHAKQFLIYEIVLRGEQPLTRSVCEPEDPTVAQRFKSFQRHEPNQCCEYHTLRR